jgi:hypothetical protein
MCGLFLYLNEVQDVVFCTYRLFSLTSKLLFYLSKLSSMILFTLLRLVSPSYKQETYVFMEISNLNLNNLYESKLV